MVKTLVVVGRNDGARDSPFNTLLLPLLGSEETTILYYLNQPGEKNTATERAGNLKTYILDNFNPAETVILARSAGGRVASLIADALQLRGVICLGYPFKHPREADDPARYRHLSQLNTPMLIVQGVNDAYGGREVGQRYAFSERVELAFVDSDHEFRIGREVLAQTAAIIRTWLAGMGGG